MIESKMERVEDPADPRRCQTNYKHGQCPYKALEHSEYCAMHGGNKAQESRNKKVMQQYQLAMWQKRVDEFADNDKVKTLRDEIGILRVVLENIIVLCKDKNQLLLFSSKIAEMVTKIERLVVSCNKLEASSGMLLDKSAALHLAGQMVEIIGRHVTDGEAIEKIANEIAHVILDMNGASIE